MVLNKFDLRSAIRLSAVFLLAAVTAACIEIALWRSQSLFSFVFPFLIYILASFRLLPWKTFTRKSLSFGLMLGVCIPLILYTAGYSL